MSDSLKLRFERYELLNPHVYPLFEQYTKQLIDAGVTRTSAWLVVNVIRWYAAIQTNGYDFKMPNDFIGIYARRFMRENPLHDDLFDIRSTTRDLNRLI